VTTQQINEAIARACGWNVSDSQADVFRLLLNSGAIQRAEAFLKTIGKWEEPK